MTSPQPQSPSPPGGGIVSTPATARCFHDHNNDDYEIKAYPSDIGTPTTHPTEDTSYDAGDASSPFIADAGSMVIPQPEEKRQQPEQEPQRQTQQENNNAHPTVFANGKRSMSPGKVRPTSRIMSGSEIAPLKILAERVDAHNHQGHSPSESITGRLASGSISGVAGAGLSAPRSPRKTMFSPEKRFPIKFPIKVAASPPPKTSSFASPPAAAAATPSSASVAAGIFDDGDTVLHNSMEGDSQDVAMDSNGSPRPPHQQTPNGNSEHPAQSNSANVNDMVLNLDTDAHLDFPAQRHSMSPSPHPQEDIPDPRPASATGTAQCDESAGPDDTMMSTFSTFSAVPSMTMFARMGQTPTSNAAAAMNLARGVAGNNTFNPSPSRTPRASVLHQGQGRAGGDDTTNLLEFSSRHVPPSTPARGGAGAAGGRRVSNLIDFDLPPMPTPRSIPTITPRELESLKSQFLSEISGLRASLSGKEAEALSLKSAVTDAEKRVGECMEEVRSLRTEEESLRAEKDGWENRGREMEKVLREVRGEIVRGREEREELEHRVQEAEGRREAAEVMAQEAESKIAGMKAGRASSDAHASPQHRRSPGPGGEKSGADKTAQEVEIAVERVARELHALYKSKHETKVGALKKSYEHRWEKRVKELEHKISTLGIENEELRLGRDVTMTKLDPVRLEREAEERREEKAKNGAEIRKLGAEVKRLEAEVGMIKGDFEAVRLELERERVEKGELVCMAEEMMNMQMQASILGASTADEPEEEEIEVAPREVVREAPQPQQQQQQKRSLAATPGSVKRKSYAPTTGNLQPTPSSRPHSVHVGLSGATPGSARISKPGSISGSSAASSSSSAQGAGGAGGAQRSSGLRAPGVSRIGGPRGVPKPGYGSAGRSGLMGSIEKMGR